MSQDIEGASLAALRDQVATTLQETRSPGFLGFLSSQVDEAWIRRGRLSGSTFAEESVDAINTLLGRRREFAQDGITTEEHPIVNRLDNQIDAIIELISNNASSLAPGSITSAADYATDLGDRVRREGNADLGRYMETLANEFRNVAKKVDEQNKIAREQLDAMKGTEANTKPKPGNPSNVIRQSANNADHRAAMETQ
ncbi:hypothetical protein RMSM_02565 [Rhodopirellula maiorica SM1]|uniref:Uncharacterized protein n=1 Tax=Rhodopirellula maiorica SM1 TaxID=1265738 RepID=M5RMI2_9BACT|nr:hypothetical protein [Rhodopirellula maiorica]EMI20533.1 hypothetical protein RMSM_02565 [Rhodopirellula maiorica SM1]